MKLAKTVCHAKCVIQAKVSAIYARIEAICAKVSVIRADAEISSAGSGEIA
jgi:hypothetical protein